MYPFVHSPFSRFWIFVAKAWGSKWLTKYSNSGHVDQNPLFLPLSDFLSLWTPGFQSQGIKVTHRILFRQMVWRRPPQSQRTLPTRLMGRPHLFVQYKVPVPGAGTGSSEKGGVGWGGIMQRTVLEQKWEDGVSRLHLSLPHVTLCESHKPVLNHSFSHAE